MIQMKQIQKHPQMSQKRNLKQYVKIVAKLYAILVLKNVKNAQLFFVQMISKIKMIAQSIKLN